MSGHERSPGSSDAGTAEVLAGLNGLRGDIAGYAGAVADLRVTIGQVSTSLEAHSRHDNERHAEVCSRIAGLEKARIKAAEGGEARGVQSGRVSERVTLLIAVGSVVATLAAKTVWDAVTTPAPPESANVAR